MGGPGFALAFLSGTATLIGNTMSYTTYTTTSGAGWPAKNGERSGGGRDNNPPRK
jgi:hypothetical protein